MNGDDGSDVVRDARRKYLVHQASRADAPPVASGTTPSSLEATLSDISAEVTAEALERRERRDKSRSGKTP